MNYTQSREYLEKVNTYGSVLGLDTIKELLRRLGNPQNSLKVVHIAGTNGKGSTGAFLQSILINSGYKTGRYSSPAVFEDLEIIKVQDKNITENDFAMLISIIKDKCDGMLAEGLLHPTSFEIETAMALLYFKQQQCDICLVECGMGGEGDATNVFDKVLCSVITSISLDHTQYLGENIIDIAKIKSGIIKPGCPVVIAPQSSEVERYIIEKAKTINSDLVIAKPLNDDFDLKMKGKYQLINASVAIEVANILEKSGFNVKRFIKKGLESAYWPGRMETISENPLIIIDGAHNPAAVKELKTSIDLYFTNSRIAFIMGVLSDKDFKKEAEIIAHKGVKIFTITPNNKRGLSGAILKDVIKEFNPNVEDAKNIEDGLNKAKAMVDEGSADMIIAFGSLSYLGELKRLVQKA